MRKPDLRCFINNEEKYVFINISKNASTSLSKTLKFTTFGEYKDIVSNYYKFIILRDPVYRSISSYLELIKLRKDGPYLITEKSEWFKEKNLLKSFSMFLDYINDNFYDSHIYPQITYLSDKGLSIDDMDCVLLHENIKEDYVSLIKSSNRIKPVSTLKKLQTGENIKKKKLTEFVSSNNEMQEKIRNIYKEDNIIYNTFKEKEKDERFNRLHNNM